MQFNQKQLGHEHTMHLVVGDISALCILASMSTTITPTTEDCQQPLEAQLLHIQAHLTTISNQANLYFRRALSCSNASLTWFKNS
jgi:hypothetical protein